MVSIYKVPERFDTLVAAAADSEISLLLEQSVYLIFDFTECRYMSSAGLRLLLKSKKALSAKKGGVMLAGVNAAMLNVLELSGMKTLFALFDTEVQAREAVGRESAGRQESVDFTYRAHSYRFTPMAHGCARMTDWSGLDLASYGELGFAVGTGFPAESLQVDPERFLTFFTTGTCAGFLDPSGEYPVDYRITAFPQKTGIYLDKACSFGTIPTGLLAQTLPGTCPLSRLMEAADAYCDVQCTGVTEQTLTVICAGGESSPSVTVRLRTRKGPQSGGTFLLAEWRTAADDSSWAALLQANLTLDNITEVVPLDPARSLQDPVCALFAPVRQVPSAQTRLVVEVDCKETGSGGRLDLYKEFLARRIYTDSARIVLKPLQGGFSAQTFQVLSFDADARRLRPTVLKVASEAMIERESVRCREYALPYIMNNSAQVIGTEFFAGMGALRYNFVGIGGEGSQLGWLTKLYQKQPLAQLEPLYDKIFTRILQPWYGQAVEKPLKLFAEHDPTLTFFPQLCDTAAQVLGIDPQQPKVFVSELDREVLNPYWYLSHEYPKNRDKTFLYYSGVCHGDLNMQNILIDDLNNVFLIDFSETKFRSVISDFARLEVIFLVDNAPVDSPRDYQSYAAFLTAFYSGTCSLDPALMPRVEYTGTQKEWVAKNVALTRRMRTYALDSVHGNTDAVSYYFALLEWVLPIVCYGSVSVERKRLSFLAAALLAEKIEKL